MSHKREEILIGSKGTYKLSEVIGQGSYGKVYRYSNYAIKRVKPN